MPECPFCGQPTTGHTRTCGSLECIKRQQKDWFDGQIAVPEGHLTVTEFAKLKGISVQAVAKNCRNEKYPGAFQDGQSGRWYIPIDAKSIGAPRKLYRRIARQTIKATDKEWNEIVEGAALDKGSKSVNDFLIHAAQIRSRELKQK